MKRKGNDDELYLANVLHFENCTVYLYRPILTPEERERRYENIRRALRRIGPSQLYGLSLQADTDAGREGTPL
nr:MAG TPA: hypothetical protein [Caudoviricetes sp.]